MGWGRGFLMLLGRFAKLSSFILRAYQASEQRKKESAENTHGCRILLSVHKLGVDDAFSFVDDGRTKCEVL
jgi:hypothetical protein